MYTRRQPKTVIVNQNRNNSNTQHRRYFSDVEIESKIKSIMLKIVQDLKRRHKNIFNNQLITEANLKENLFCLLKEEDLTKFDYNKFLSKAEQECIIEHLRNPKTNKTTYINEININSNSSKTLNDFAKEENLNNKSYNFTKSVDPLKSMLSPLANNSILNPMHCSIKYDELKNIKEKDEWGILTKKKKKEKINEKIKKLQKKKKKKKKK